MATPLDAERARLRAEGHTDAEISQIFILRAVDGNSQQAAGAAPVQGGNMSGVLGNANAVLSHARATIPVLKADLETLSSSTAPAKSRAKSFAVLAFAAVIAAVLAFAVYQEWQRQIIFETEIQKQQAASARAQSCQTRLNVAVGMRLELSANTPAIRQVLADCSDYFTPHELERLARSASLPTPSKPLTEEECTKRQAFRLMNFDKDLQYEQALKKITPSDPDVLECLKQANLQR
jgi:hypothetical protein